MAQKERIAYLTQAALEGDVKSQFKLGYYAFKGIHVKKDVTAAEKWFRMAAAQDHSKGLFCLAVVLERRVKTFEDEMTVARFYKRTADKGVSGAQYKYAVFILNEKAGIKKDIEKVCQLLEKAADFYHIAAKKVIYLP